MKTVLEKEDSYEEFEEEGGKREEKFVEMIEEGELKDAVMNATWEFGKEEET